MQLKSGDAVIASASGQAAVVAPVAVAAWIDPDPSDSALDGSWDSYTVRGTGLTEVSIRINVPDSDQSDPGSIEFTRLS